MNMRVHQTYYYEQRKKTDQKQDHNVLQKADFMFQTLICLASHDPLQFQHIKAI